MRADLVAIEWVLREAANADSPYFGKIVVWVNGAGTSSSGYRNMLNNVAAHGFFLLDDKQSTFNSAPEVEAQRAAIDWALAQNDKPGGPYFGKLDPKLIAIAGHSMGSISSFGNVKDPRVKTSVHMAGGISNNPEGGRRNLAERSTRAGGVFVR